MGKLGLSKVGCIVFVFCVATAVSSPAQTFTTLVNFNGTNGADPSLNMSLVQGIDGNFYGTTSEGGTSSGCSTFGCGTVFKITPAGTLTVLYSFCAQANCTDGAEPSAGLVQASDGNFYGTTVTAGATCCGTVFRITPAGTLTTLHSFNGSFNGADGALIWAGLVQATDGNFYGTTANGGATSYGTVFKITPGGTLTTLYNFCAQTGCPDGASPLARLVQASDGNFYGTTGDGGANNVPACNSSLLSSFVPAANGCGTVFKIAPGGTLSTLYSFCAQTNCTDGANPSAGLVQATDGNFYGTTAGGGANGNVGTVFRITPAGTLTTLYSFCAQTNCTDGAYPFAGLVQGTDGNFYGTTNQGGGGLGTVFKITSAGTLTTLHSFNGSYPSGPYGLVQATDGIFYGTTELDGDSTCNAPVGCGTVFRLGVGLGPFVKTLPTSGAVGAAVVILGSNLTGATSVKFNGTGTTFTVVSSSEIQTAVPVGATSGTVQVTTPSGTLNSNVPFQVTKPRKRRAQVTSE